MRELFSTEVEALVLSLRTPKNVGRIMRKSLIDEKKILIFSTEMDVLGLPLRNDLIGISLWTKYNKKGPN